MGELHKTQNEPEEKACEISEEGVAEVAGGATIDHGAPIYSTGGHP